MTRGRRGAAGLSHRIVYEDDHILVVNKPSGLLTSTGPRERRPTLLAQVRDHIAAQKSRTARVGLIHRLDRDARGLLIFSKNDRAYRSLKSQFFHHSVIREYQAVVHGIPDPPNGKIQTHLVERADGTVHSTRQHEKGQKAVTIYQTLKSQGKLTLLGVILQTGRKHQIRAHLRERGWPIVGDRTYGSDDGTQQLMLCATRLTVIHPRTGREMTFRVRPPHYFPLLLDQA